MTPDPVLSVRTVETLVEANRRALNTTHLMLDITERLLTKLAAGRRPSRSELVEAQFAIMKFKAALAEEDRHLAGMTEAVASLRAGA